MKHEFTEHVFNSITGATVESFQLLGVENLFSEGKPCMELYTSAINAAWRVCDRLGVDEDDDVEIIINSLLKITKIVSCRMYEYGAEFGIAGLAKQLT